MSRENLANLALSDNGGLFDSATGHTFTLNATGTFIMKRLISGVPREAVIKALVSEYDVSADTAGMDYDQFIHYCTELGVMKDERTS